MILLTIEETGAQEAWTVKNQNLQALVHEEQEEHVLGVIMTKYSLKKGLQMFKKKGEEAVATELQKLHCMETFIPVHKQDMWTSKIKQCPHSCSMSTNVMRPYRDGWWPTGGIREKQQ